MNGLNWQTWHMPLAAGLNQKPDPRALQAPELTICKDVQFDEIGGLQTRLPYAALGSDVLGGGSITEARRIVVNGSELLLFDKDSLYSWNAQLSKWVSRGTHLAIKVDEESVFVSTGDQIEGDRAELDGVIVYAWRDASTVYVAAMDKTTGSVLVAPTAVTVPSQSTRPRLVALETKILLFIDESSATGITVRAIDPADVATGIASSATVVLSGANSNSHYDATRILGADDAVIVMRQTPTTSYSIARVTSALSSVQVVKERVCDGPIAVSSSPDGTLVQVVRANGTDIEGDLLSAEVGAGGSFEDVFTDQAIGTVNDDCEQIAVAHRSVTDDDEYQCHVFWSDDQIVFPTTGSGRTKHNWVDTGGSIGTESVLVEALGVASRAFDHDGSVYVNLVFAGVSDMGFGSGVAYGHPAAVQNTYFLYRDDGFLCAKAAANRAGGFAPSVGHLPAVIETEDNTYTWVGTERRIVPFGGKHDGYADRGPRDITFAFDSDEARRCVRLGQTLYVTGGEILQYDGTRLTEVGFHTFPYYFSAFEDLEEGDLGEGTYYYKITYRWDNGRGELDRSTTATHGGVAIVSPPGSVVLSTISPLHVTHKTDSPPAIEIWRTLVNPGDDAPYYLVTSKDPTDLTGDNRYIANDTTIGLVPDFDDLLVDDDARELESSPENGGVLENLAPPAATIIAAGDTRLFLAGVAGDPHRIWYSKQRPDGEVAAFHEALTVPVPSDGGEITALAFLNETLIAFRESSIYALAGDGFDNFGAGSNYGPARSLSFDIGAVNHESLATTDRGIVFKSRKGWYLLNRGWSLEYIGGQVSDYDDETPLAVNSLESQHQIRIVTASRVLVLDTLVGQWSEWSIDDGLDATIWQGTYAYLTDAGPKIEQATHTDLTYGFDIETAWIKLADLQGYKRIRALAVLGEYRSAFRLRIRLARDYRTGYFDDSNWTPSPVEVGGPMQVRIGPSIQQVEAIKIRLTATSVTEEAASITFESGGSTLVVSALVPGPDGNLIDLANDGGAGESPPSIVEAVDPESDRWVITMSSEETSTFDLVAAALNTSALVSAAVVGEGSTTFPISSIFSGSLEGGTVVESAPSGEAAKLTGIGFEFGLKRGLFRHLPSAQKR